MSTRTSAASAFAAPAPTLLPRSARTHVNTLGTEGVGVRLLVVGTAGSGKTRLLRELTSLLAERGLAVWSAASAADVADVPDDHVMVVDDAHLADAETLEAIANRVADPAASLIVATRSWPLPDMLVKVAAELERSHPPIVLGHVSATEVSAHLAETGRLMERRCLDDILELTSRFSWLVSEAIMVHDDLTCPGGPHSSVSESLRDLIAHRLDGLDAATRAAVVAACLAQSVGNPSPLTEQTALAGYAAGLLQRNGLPAPVVAQAVRATVPVERLIEEYAASYDTAASLPPTELVGSVRDPRIVQALLALGDDVLARDPRRAAELYRGATDAGAEGAIVIERRARAAWAMGEIDAAGSLIDELAGRDTPPSASAAITGAAVWAARGDLSLSDATFAGRDIDTAEEMAHATIAAVGAADVEALDRLGKVTPGRTQPATLSVSLDLLTRGVRSSVTAAAVDTLGSLVRASEMYSAAASVGPICELPAILAAATALNMGDPIAAQSVLDHALDSEQAGGWARARLRLWQAWVLVQRERPVEAKHSLGLALAGGPLSPRDRLLADAVEVALARRYGDSAALAQAWENARASILRAQFDLYTLHPLTEFTLTAARLGDFDRIRPHLDSAFAAVSRLGDPPLWSAHLHWAGLHASILRNEPDGLVPHARALVAASAHSRPAARMAQAGRVWTDVLGGAVDVDAIEAAALGLAEVGLAWDGARLASYAAGRSTDRREIGRLLACARQLHPREKALFSEDETSSAEEATASPSAAEVLSAREREVAVLVLEGKTYAEIGESIFISPRTAEHHIARIRRRLGATSRSDLIAKLRTVMSARAEDRG
ncbi:LuxR C-terminal-related transcriptional regulator [Microbacterium sp. P04]|uniref:helix-turn-helix transcriptional regulator n=1 Tax=Microbacterium sp. P04 TaxID=3366947 RepID=UPI003744C36D